MNPFSHHCLTAKREDDFSLAGVGCMPYRGFEPQSGQVGEERSAKTATLLLSSCPMFAQLPPRADAALLERGYSVFKDPLDPSTVSATIVVVSFALSPPVSVTVMFRPSAQFRYLDDLHVGTLKRGGAQWDTFVASGLFAG